MEAYSRFIRERGYSNTKSNWEKALPKIEKNKEKFLAKLQEEATKNSQGNLTQEEIEKQAAVELLGMGPKQVEKVVRDYDTFLSEHGSLLENPQVGFRLEFQRHWIPKLISMANDL